MKKCPKCSRKIKPAAAYCENCGNKVSSLSPNEIKAWEKKKANKPPGGLIFIFIVIGFFIFISQFGSSMYTTEDLDRQASKRCMWE